MSYLVDFQPLALKAMRLEALLPTKALTQIKDKVYIDRDTVSLLIIFQYRNEVGLCDALTPLQSADSEYININSYFLCQSLCLSCNDMHLY